LDYQYFVCTVTKYLQIEETSAIEKTVLTAKDVTTIPGEARTTEELDRTNPHAKPTPKRPSSQLILTGWLAARILCPEASPRAAPD
jgi:hypothetical protein